MASGAISVSLIKPNFSSSFSASAARAICTLRGDSSMTAAQPSPARVFFSSERRAVEIRIVVPQVPETKKDVADSPATAWPSVVDVFVNFVPLTAFGDLKTCVGVLRRYKQRACQVYRWDGNDALVNGVCDVRGNLEWIYLSI